MELIIESVEVVDRMPFDVRVLYFFDPVDDRCREMFIDKSDFQYSLPEEVQDECIQWAENEDGKWKYFDWEIAEAYFYDDMIETATQMATEILNQPELS